MNAFMHTHTQIILDLCGGTGSWSKPYKEAGYDVRVITLPEYDVTKIKSVYISGMGRALQLIREDEESGDSLREHIFIDEIYGILAAPPCTEFSVLNCIAEPRKRNEAAGMVVVDACINIIHQCNPKFWALENPRGNLRKYLGKPKLTFQPWWYGDPWTKATDIWGKYNLPEPLYTDWNDVPKLNLYTRPGREKPNFAFLHKSAWVNIPQLQFYKPETDAEFRAMTPPGFAKAFFEANR